MIRAFTVFSEFASKSKFSLVLTIESIISMAELGGASLVTAVETLFT